MLKKIYKLILAMIVTLTCIPIHTVYAEVVDIPEVYSYRYTFLNGPGANGFDAPMDHRMYQGRDAYCIEAGVPFTTEDLYQKDDFNRYGALSEEAKETIMLASAFGHGYRGRDDAKYYCAAQEIIWNAGGTRISWAGDDAVIKSAKQEIQRDIDNYRKTISWQLYDTVEDKVIAIESGVTADVVLNRVYRITDLNHSLNSFTLNQIDNLHIVDENGNPKQFDAKSDSFYVKVTNENVKASLQFITGYTDRFQDIPLVLFGDGIQNCIATGDLQPKSFSLSLKANELIITPNKVNENMTPQNNIPMDITNKNGEKVNTYNSSDVKQYRFKIGETYTFDELDAPDGYYCKKFTIDATVDKADQTVNLVNDEKIQYEILKVDENDKPIKGARLALYDMTSGTPTLVKMDQNPWVSDSNPKDVSSYLHCGHTYAVVEEDASTKFFLAETQSFTVAKYAPNVNEKTTIRIVDSHITYLIAKVDENGNPVEGAQLKIFDEDDYGHEVYSFTTGLTPTRVGNLERGHTYRIQETITPDGRYTMDEKLFTVDTYGSSPITIYAKDETIVYYATKTDKEGNSVVGAQMALYDISDDENTLVQSFVTTDEPTRLEGLITEHTYRLEEVATPLGYYEAESVIFTIPRYGTSEPVYINVIDEKIDVVLKKVDMDNHPLADITLQVIDKDSKEIIGTWLTNPDTDIQVGHLLQHGKTYILKESEVVNGYYKSADVEFQVPNRTSEQPIVITMVDEAIDVSVLKVNRDHQPIEGVTLQLRNLDEEILYTWTSTKEPQVISSYVHAGDTYIIHEESTVPGYYYADDYAFTIDEYVDQNEPIQIEIVDEPIQYDIIKVDENEQPIAGVTLKLTDVNTNEEIETWITEDVPKRFDNQLQAEHTYLLTEEEWVNGLLQATSITFTVPRQNTSITILQMVDEYTNISFLKVDDQGRPLADAKLSILDENKEVITSFTSTNNMNGVSEDNQGRQIASLLKGGSTYYLHEDEAPLGFTLAQDIEFVMEGSNQNPQVIIMENQPDTLYLKIRKSDIENEDIFLEGAVYGLFNAKTDEEICDREGDPITLQSDISGVDEVQFAYNQDGFYIQEVQAPTGYTIDHTHHEVQPTLTTGFIEQKPVFLEVKDEQEVPTSTIAFNGLISLFCMMICGVCCIYSKRLF